MDKLPYILFAIGILFFIMYIIMTVNRIMKNKKGGVAWIICFFLLGAFFTGASLITLFKSADIQRFVANRAMSPTPKSATKATNQKVQQTVAQDTSFDANGSVKPKVVYPEGYLSNSARIYTDADGTQSVVHADTTLLVISPNGVRGSIDDTWGASVEVPMNGYKDGKFHYVRYSYSVSNVDGEAVVTEEDNAMYNKVTDPIGGNAESSKAQILGANDPGSKLSNVDFIYN